MRGKNYNTGPRGRRLTRSDHSRASAGLTYVYPVVSRRAGGVSLGVNLNPNNACNWRCIYCQVPDLRRGAAPRLDLDLLAVELGGMLEAILRGDFLQRRVPPGARRLNDVAISGNGEPTTSRQFEAAVACVAAAMQAARTPAAVKLVLISNGSRMLEPQVQAGLERMARANGEAWFKLDSATHEGMARINSVRLTPERVRANLEACAARLPTWLQTCVFRLDGAPPGAAEQAAYLAFVEGALRAGVALRGVLLYGLARQPLQPEAPRLSPVGARWMERFAARIRGLGLEVRVSC